jgi:hypothetical protein
MHGSDSYIMTFEKNTTGWMSFGLGTGKMIKMDTMVVEFFANNTYQLYDQWSERFGRPKNDADIGGKYDFINPNYKFSNGIYSVSFTRKLNTGDPYDIIMEKPKANVTFYYAWGSKAYGFHGDNVGSSSFSIGANDEVTFSNEFIEPSKFFLYHGLILLCSWTILNFIGICIARYLKHLTYWVWLHRLFNGSAAIATIILGSMGLYQMMGVDHLLGQIHYINGIIMIGLSAIQLVFGNVIYYYITSDSLRNQDMLKYKVIHRIIGYFITLQAVVNMILGCIFGLTSLLYWVIGIITLLVIIWLMLFAINHLSEKNRYTKYKSLENDEVVVYYSKEDLKKLTQDYVFYDNNIVDVTEFMNHHPGGRLQLKESLKQDITRYIIGSVALNQNFSPHKHSFLANKHIVGKLTMGVLIENHNLILDMNKKSCYVDEDCEILASNSIAKNTFEIKVLLSNRDLKIPKFLPGFEWMGKHFAVTSKNLAKTRLYSICLCLNSDVLKMQEVLLSNIQQLEDSQTCKEIYENLETESKSIEIYVKKYDYLEALSSYITISGKEKSTDLMIKGPIGLGLDLGNVLSGTYVAFGGGTGVFCFIDFISYVLRYITDKIAREKFQYSHNRLFKEEDFSSVVKDDFKLIYFSTFADEESAVYHTICEKLQNLDKKYQLNVFRYIPRFSNKDKKRWDTAFLCKELESLKYSITRAFVCGPTPFLDQIKQSLTDGLIVEKDKIFLI